LDSVATVAIGLRAPDSCWGTQEYELERLYYAYNPTSLITTRYDTAWTDTAPRAPKCTEYDYDASSGTLSYFPVCGGDTSIATRYGQYRQKVEYRSGSDVEVSEWTLIDLDEREAMLRE
jgi:hypothetical protein